MSDLLSKISIYSSIVAVFISLIATFLAYRNHQMTVRSLKSKMGPLSSNSTVEEMSSRGETSSDENHEGRRQ